MFRSVFLLGLLACLVVGKHEQYDGYGLYAVKVTDSQQAALVNDLETYAGIDVWSQVTPSREGLVLVPRESRQFFEKELTNAGIKYKIQEENIKESLELEDKLLNSAAGRSNSSDQRISFDTIHRLDAVNRYMDDLASKYSTVSVVTGGKSFEGRDIKYLKISTTNFQDNRKPIIMIQSLLHAREWVTLPAALYAIEKLVVDVTDRDLVDKIDWIVLPVANPDGYEFTHTTTRFWRKNRATGFTIANVCMGVDLNRNFDIFWGTASSNNACSETFHGRGPFSEPETAVIRDIVLEHVNRIELYLDIHSFGSMILYPYGNGDFPANALTLNVVGVRMAQAIDAVKWPSKPNYIVGNSALVLYVSSGGADDYARALGISLSYTFELPAFRNQQNSLNGFLVDPDFIEQAGYETWEGIKAGARFVLEYV